MAAALSLGALAGCGSGDTGTSPEGGGSSAAQTGDGAKSDAKLEIWVYGWEKASADKIQEDTAAYGEATGVEVTVVPIASDSYSTKIKRRSRAATTRTSPLSMRACRARSSRRRASCSASMITASGSTKTSSTNPCGTRWSIRMRVYGLRITSNNLALFYNKELFREGRP